MASKELFSKKEIKEIARLSQEEGLNDTEIAKIFYCHRVTITRSRARHNIPRPNLRNRKDKEQVCKRCGAIKLIRRKHRLQKYCKKCQSIRNEERREEKRKYMQAREK